MFDIHSGVMYMIDMHNHVLFGVDDGCNTMEESIAMVEAANDAGVTDIILTPHYGPLRGYVADWTTIQSHMKQLQQAIANRELPVKLYLGREIDEIKHIEELLKSGTVQPMNHTNYVLVDFGMKKTDVDEYIYELIIQGYQPIIAHPERYNYIKDPSEFKKWRQTGALLQINASSVFHPKNKQVKKYVNYMLKHGLVDMVGSDCHRNPKNYQDFGKAMKLIEKKYPTIQLQHDRLLKESSQ